MSREEFRETIVYSHSRTPFDCWVALVDNEVIAYATCWNIDGVVIITIWKSTPDALKQRPNNALIFELTRYYLREEGVKYVSNGWRSLFHPTGVGSFMAKMGYRRCYARLGVMLGTQANMVVGLGLDRLGKRLSRLPGKVGRFGRQLGALNQAVSISKICRELPAT